MNISLTSEQEAKLSEIAAHKGVGPEEFMCAMAQRLIEDDEQFRAAVREGIAAADRGELTSHDEVAAQMEELFASE